MMAPPIVPLSAAIQRFVEPGMHLHFASTPSRANAAIREIARTYFGKQPNFTISTSGFHSLIHLLGILRLGRRYLACFFGDNYPEPRPNRLYATLVAEGADLEHWSLLSYVSALRAGALGQPYALVRPPSGTTLEAELASRGRAFEVADPRNPDARLRLMEAIRPDITFVHAAAADEDGHVLASAPYSEGNWSALGASRGAIVTVETIVGREVSRRWPQAIRIPPHRICAIAVEPFGAHPQPLYVAPGFGVSGYRDDYAAYEQWRSMAQDPDQFGAFADAVLRASDGGAAYRAFVGEARLEELRGPESPSPKATTPKTASELEASADDARMVILAARQIVRRVRSRGHRVILAGIGHAFFAARLARRWLAAEGIDVPVMVETGLYDVDCGSGADSFLLSQHNIERAARHSEVEDVLGALTCGADNACIGVIGAAQIDAKGRVNSTRLANGRLLVGSGGASDIAASAAEVVVLAPCRRDRLVLEVDYVTSPGDHVLGIATERGVLFREEPGAPWSITELYPFGDVDVDVGKAAATIADRCAFSLDHSPGLGFTTPIADEERMALADIDPEARYHSPGAQGT